MISEKIRTIFVPQIGNVESHINWLLFNRSKNHNFKEFPAKAIWFDFKKSNFIRPYHIAPLACLIHEYKEKGFKVLLKNIPDSIKESFSKFNFYQFCTKESIGHFPEPITKTTLPLWRIEQEAISMYPVQAQRYFEGQHFDGKSLFGLGRCLAELLNNVFDHSESKIPGYTFTDFNPNSKEIITCVCDFGIGIPEKVNKFLKNENKPSVDNLTALTLALTNHFSTKSKPHNRGFGLGQLFDIFRALKGRILIVSNNSLFEQDYNGQPKSKLFEVNFPGTLVVLYLKTDNLPAREEEITDELQII